MGEERKKAQFDAVADLVMVMADAYVSGPTGLVKFDPEALERNVEEGKIKGYLASDGTMIGIPTYDPSQAEVWLRAAERRFGKLKKAGSEEEDALA